MTILAASQARRRWQRLLDEVSASHEPVQITGKRAAVVLVSAADWRAIQESLFLRSIPGMRRPIVTGMKTPVAACVRRLDW